MEDEDIIRQVLAGKHEHYAFLVQRYQEPLIRFLQGMLKSDEEAFDCVQEAFLAAYRNLWRYSNKHTFRAWLYAIARNKALDLLRKRKRTSQTQLDELIADHAPGPEDQWLAKERDLKVKEVLAKLPEHYRQTLYLRYQQELSYEEIAHILEVPVSRVKTYLHRGKEKLRQQLEVEGLHGNKRYMDSTVSG